jgi:hypothetical protein
LCLHLLRRLARSPKLRLQITNGYCLRAENSLLLPYLPLLLLGGLNQQRRL